MDTVVNTGEIGTDETSQSDQYKWLQVEIDKISNKYTPKTLIKNGWPKSEEQLKDAIAILLLIASQIGIEDPDAQNQLYTMILETSNDPQKIGLILGDYGANTLIQRLDGVSYEELKEGTPLIILSDMLCDPL